MARSILILPGLCQPLSRKGDSHAPIYCRAVVLAYHREFHAENIRHLRAAGYDCFVPQEQEHNAHQSKSIPAQVFAVDLAGVRSANALVALLDDPDVSSGTACEMGIFYELMQHDQTKKGMLGILTDYRPRLRDTSKRG